MHIIRSRINKVYKWIGYDEYTKLVANFFQCLVFQNLLETGHLLEKRKTIYVVFLDVYAHYWWKVGKKHYNCIVITHELCILDTVASGCWVYHLIYLK